MFSKRLLPLAILLAGLLVMPAMVSQSVSAAPDSSFTTEIVQGEVSMSLPADVCTQLPGGVALDGKGKRYQVLVTKIRDDGTKTVISNDFIQGKATDNLGGKYKFLYSNQARYEYPAGAGPIAIDMTDSFILDNRNGANDYSVAFKWQWTFTPPAGEWPPVDNWKQKLTIGDPLTCDPL